MTIDSLRTNYPQLTINSIYIQKTNLIRKKGKKKNETKIKPISQKTQGEWECRGVGVAHRRHFGFNALGLSVRRSGRGPARRGPTTNEMNIKLKGAEETRRPGRSRIEERATMAVLTWARGTNRISGLKSAPIERSFRGLAVERADVTWERTAPARYARSLSRRRWGNETRRAERGRNKRGPPKSWIYSERHPRTGPRTNTRDVGERDLKQKKKKEKKTHERMERKVYFIRRDGRSGHKRAKSMSGAPLTRRGGPRGSGVDPPLLLFKPETSQCRTYFCWKKRFSRQFSLKSREN